MFHVEHPHPRIGYLLLGYLLLGYLLLGYLRAQRFEMAREGLENLLTEVRERPTIALQSGKSCVWPNDQ